MTKVMLATCATYPDLTESDGSYADALTRRGADVGFSPWQTGLDPFLGADLVVIRSAWDYHREIDAYRRWLNGLEAEGLCVANPLPLVRWNLEKSYINDLSAAAIPTPVQHIVPCDLAAVRTVLETTGWSQAVVKPIVGASGHGVELVTPDTLDGLWPTVDAAMTPHAVVVQEFVPEIREHGQVSFVFLGGRFSHAVRFLPAGGDFRLNAPVEPTIEPVDVDRDEIAAAANVVAALPIQPLYARIDTVRQGERLLLLEAEVNEPGLLFQYVPEAAEVFADATLEWLRIDRDRQDVR